MKTIIFIILSACLFACSTNKEEEERSVLKIDIEQKETSILEEMTPVEEQVEELTYYQKAREKHPEKDILPQGIVIQTNDRMIIGDVNFVTILKIYDNYFLTKFTTYGADVENIYYLTFDYNGNQLAAEPVLTLAIDLDGKIVFTTDSTFQVNTIQKQIEWIEADIIEVGEPTKDTVYYHLTNNGKIKTIDKITFYNKELKRLFPSRVLHTQYQSKVIDVMPEALENVEGGGLSRKYLRVVNEYDLEIGVVMYEMSAVNKPITLSIAILEEGNNLISSTLCYIDGNTVLRLKSNRTGNPDKGPYDYNYYTYTGEMIIIQPVLTKSLIDNEPIITIIDENTSTSNIRILRKKSNL